MLGQDCDFYLIQTLTDHCLPPSHCGTLSVSNTSMLSVRGLDNSIRRTAGGFLVLSNSTVIWTTEDEKCRLNTNFKENMWSLYAFMHTMTTCFLYKSRAKDFEVTDVNLFNRFSALKSVWLELDVSKDCMSLKIIANLT